MKCESKSALNRIFAILFLTVLSLSACADVRGPSWMTGEPDDSVLNEPRVVGRPTKAMKDGWPNLSEVPDKKPRFITDATIEDDVVEMNSDRLQADVEKERLRNIPLGERTYEEKPTSEEPFSFSALKP